VTEAGPEYGRSGAILAAQAGRRGSAGSAAVTERPGPSPLAAPPSRRSRSITVEVAYLAARVRLLRDAIELSHLYRRQVPHPVRLVA